MSDEEYVPVSELVALVHGWLSYALSQQDQPEGTIERAQGVERERCARELARGARISIRIVDRPSVRKRRILVSADPQSPTRGERRAAKAAAADEPRALRPEGESF